MRNAKTEKDVKRETILSQWSKEIHLRPLGQSRTRLCGSNLQCLSFIEPIVGFLSTSTLTPTHNSRLPTPDSPRILRSLFMWASLSDVTESETCTTCELSYAPYLSVPVYGTEARWTLHDTIRLALPSKAFFPACPDSPLD
jgi:hypothetical protein